PPTVLLFTPYDHPLHLLSFPTRRSSDLFGAVTRSRDGPDIGLSGLVAHALLAGDAVLRVRQNLQPLARNLAAAALADSETSFLKDRKSTRLNSSHVKISYAVFCLKKKKT